MSRCNDLKETNMHVLAIGQLTGKDIQPHLEAEGRAVARLRAEGVIRDVFLKKDRTGPILLLSNTDAAEAEQRLQTLPFIEHDLVRFEFVELEPLPSERNGDE
jgi:hypothetical protein